MLLILLCVLSSSATGQTSTRTYPPISNRISPSEVADTIFPPMRIGSDLYNTRLILRFTHPDMEIVVTRMIGGQSEVKEYTLDHDQTISNAIRLASREKPLPTMSDVAQKISVHVTTRQVPSARIERWMSELKESKAPPAISNIVCLEDCPTFDLWLDTRQDSVHYRFRYSPDSPVRGSAQDILSHWMLKVRSELSAVHARQ